MTRSHTPPADRRGSAPRPADLLWGALVPPLALGAAAAMLLAVTQPPFNELTGLGRWDVFAMFGAAGAALNLWLVTLPVGLPLALLALRRRGRFGWGEAAACAAVAALILTTATALIAAGGPTARIGAELYGWGRLFAASSAGFMTLVRVGVLAAERLRGGAGQAPRADLASRT